MLRELEYFGRDLQKLARQDEKVFAAYIAWLIFVCEVIHTCLIM